MTLAGLVILIAGLQAAEPIIVPFLLSMFLAMTGVPLLTRLRKWGVPRSVAIVLVVLAMGVVLVGLGSVVASTVSAFQGELPRYEARLSQLMMSLQEWLSGRGLEISVEESLQAELVSLFNRDLLLLWGGNILSSVANIVSTSVLVVLTAIFMLSEAAGLPAKMQAAFGRSGGSRLELSGVVTQVHRYLIIKTVVSLITGLLLGLWVWILGVDFPVLWGLLAFVLNYIPNIGSILAAGPPVVLALIMPEGGVGLALAAILGYLTVNIVVGSIVEPTWMGERLGLSTLVVFLSLVFWGWVWGGVGMLLSVPLTMIAKILLQNSDDLRWIAVLMDKAPGEDALARVTPTSPERE
jgi:predicted PurR-regulated permease PerM